MNDPSRTIAAQDGPQSDSRLAVRLERANREQWAGVCARFTDHNYRQCWDYGTLLARRRGACSEHVVIRRGSDVLGAADVRIKRLPVVGGIAYVSGGPVCRTACHDLEHLAACLAALRGEYVEKRGLVLRITCPARLREKNAETIDCFRSGGFTPTSRAPSYRTILLDLSPSSAELRAGLKQKWRNCLNKAERSGLLLREGTDTATFEEFQLLFDRFTTYKGFSTDLDAAFYGDLQRALDARDALHVVLAEYDGEVVAGHVSSMLGDTCVYLLGATSAAGLKHNAGYALQWHTVTVAKQLGFTAYDLGGIDPELNPGVYHFKSGIGGEEITAPGPFELSGHSLTGPFVLAAERGLKALQHWRRGRRSAGTSERGGQRT